MHRVWGTCGALFAGLAVMAGAFAAHGLDRVFTEKYAGQTRLVAGESVPLAKKFLADFHTGAEYQMYHALALLAVGAMANRRPSWATTIAGVAFLAGIVLFSGSLYVLTLTGVTRWGAVTPFGGLSFLVGWAALAVACVHREWGNFKIGSISDMIQSRRPTRSGDLIVSTLKYVYWQDGDAWLGYLQEYPDYVTQGESKVDLEDHLRDLYADLTSGEIAGVRKVGELVIP